MAEYEGLKFTVSSDINSSLKDIENFRKTIEKLNNTIKKFDVSRMVKKVKELSKAIKSIDVGTLAKLNRITNALNGLGKNKLNKSTLTGNAASQKKVVENLSENKPSLSPINAEKPKLNFSSKFKEPFDNAKFKIKDLQANLSNSDNIGRKALGGILGASIKLAHGIGTVKNKVLELGKQKISGLKKELLSIGKSALKSLNPLNLLSKTTKKVTVAFKNVGNALKRILIYRTLRFVISQITQAFQQGVGNVIAYSQAINGSLYSAITKIQIATTYMINSLGAMASPLIEAIAPAIDFLIDKFVALLNIINQVFSVLTGKGSWTKAIKGANMFGKEVKGTGGSARKAKKDIDLYLASFDELHVLNKPSKPSSGGGSSKPSGLDYGSMFKQESIESPIKNFANKIKEFVKAEDWKGLGIFIGDSINEGINSIDFNAMGSKVGKGLNAIFTTSYNLLHTINWVSIGNKIGDFLNSAIRKVDFRNIGGLLAQKITIPFMSLIGFIQTFDWSKFSSQISQGVIGFFDELSCALKSIDWAKLGITLGNELIETFREYDWGGVAQSIYKFLKTAIESVLSLIVGLGASIATSLFDGINDNSKKTTTSIDDVKKAVKGMMDKVKAFEPILAGITAGFVAYKIALVASKVASVAFTGATTALNVATGLLNGTLKLSPFGWVATTIGLVVAAGVLLYKNWDTVKAKANDLWNGIKSVWDNIKNTTKNIWNGIAGTIKSVIDKIKGFFNFKWQWPKLKMPHFRIENGSLNPLDWIKKGIPRIKVDWYAQGGFPNMGEMFVARESGPELVGKMGNRNVVANNNQIIEGIKRGVIEAMSGISRKSDGTPITITLDGEVIYKNVIKKHSEHYAMTGVSDLLEGV